MMYFQDLSEKDKLLASEFVGALSGDGFIGRYNGSYIIQLTGDRNKDSEYLRYLGDIIYSLFNDLNLRYEFDGNALRLTIASKNLFNFIKKEFEFPKGKKGNKLSIPKCVKEDSRYINVFIRGLFDTDGCLYFDNRSRYNKPYPRMVIKITSKDLLDEVYDYLNNHFSLYRQEKKRVDNFGKGVSYSIEIYGRKQLKKWINLINFSNQRHIDKL